MPDPPSGRDDEGWTSYSPLPPPPNAGVCSFCGERQAPDRLVLMSGDGKVGICEHCTASHAHFSPGDVKHATEPRLRNVRSVRLSRSALAGGSRGAARPCPAAHGGQYRVHGAPVRLQT